ncbi:unnamed protein product, partial [Nesidiocoris tenuis]
MLELVQKKQCWSWWSRSNAGTAFQHPFGCRISNAGAGTAKTTLELVQQELRWSWSRSNAAGVAKGMLELVQD